MTPEGYVKKAVCDLLDAERILYWRMNAGATVLTGAGGKKRMIRGHGAGTADILAAPLVPSVLTLRKEKSFPKPVFLWIEVKSDTGKQSPVQRSFQRLVEAQGHIYIIARSSDDVLAKLRELGCTSTESHPIPTRHFDEVETAF